MMFQAERLILARSRRGLNKTQLAKAMGLKPPTISAYEKETSVPSDETVERFAQVLGFPTEFFYEELPEILPKEGASFRALSKKTASQVAIAKATGTLCIELNRWIEGRFNLPDPDVPEIDPIVATPAAAATYVRTAWGLGDSPIPNLLHLLESHGVRVFSLVPECRDIGAFSFWIGRPFMCIRTDRTAERSIFDMAHELGHLVLHRDTTTAHGPDAEKQANAFAANFLMPENDVRARAPRNPDLAMLVEAKTRWRVSVAALNYRLHELGLMKPWHYRELCIEISRLGRYLEINPLPREHSQVLEKVLKALRDEGVKRSDIAQAVRIDPDDFEGLLSGLVVTSLEGGGESGDSHQRPTLRLVANDPSSGPERPSSRSLFAPQP